jgi:uncharacterized protein YcnI
VTFGAAAVGAVAFAAPAAAANVTVTPSQATAGDSAELAFRIPEERAGAYTTKVELVAPQATPIAEMYALSVNDWAPASRTRHLEQPVELIHGTLTADVVDAIIWTRVANTPPADPGAPDVLTVALGPMPQADRIAFTIVQTYSDGTVVRWADPPADPAHPAPSVALVGEAAGGQGQDATADAVAEAENGTAAGGYSILGAGLLLCLVAGFGFDGWIILRAVRRVQVVAPKTIPSGP